MQRPTVTGKVTTIAHLPLPGCRISAGRFYGNVYMGVVFMFLSYSCLKIAAPTALRL